MATTRSSLAIVLCCLLLSNLASASVDEICRKIIAAKQVSVNYDFCVKILGSDPASAAADERGIAVISGKVGSRKAQTALAKVNNLLKTATAPMKVPLEVCQGLYDKAVGKLLAAATAANAGNYSDANINFTFGVGAAATCEGGFSQKKLRSPLLLEDGELVQICAIGAALTHNSP